MQTVLQRLNGRRGAGLASPCTRGHACPSRRARAGSWRPVSERHAALTILDSIAWAHDRLLPRLSIRRKAGSAVIHPSCSAIHLGLGGKLHAIAAALAAKAITPASAGCCAFAGDRGFLHPELTRSATAAEAEAVGAEEFDAYLGSNRTCDIGLSTATGKNYESFIHLLEELTR